MRKIHDISLPLFNGMWAYRLGWENSIQEICSTASGDPSTAYRFNLCSHSGTYIETSQHKLNTKLPLDAFPLDNYFQSCTVISIPAPERREISKQDFITASTHLVIPQNKALILSTGWGQRNRDEKFISHGPFLSEALVDYLIEIRPSLLGFDLPVIDHPFQPYQAVAKLFSALPNLLLLAPLVINPTLVKTGAYELIAAPLNIQGACASLCRSFLIEVT